MNESKTTITMILRNAFLKGVGLAAGFVTTSLFAAAAAINVFSPGDVISATKINQNFAIAAPEGAIMAFYLASCPEGWAPADGTNGTPDLRGQFVRGRDDVGTGAAGRDPTGSRSAGSVQQDAFQGHWHSLTNNSVSGSDTIPVLYSTGYTMIGELTNGQVGRPISDGTNGPPRTSGETRPTNVALTYCMRKN